MAMAVFCSCLSCRFLRKLQFSPKSLLVCVHGFMVGIIIILIAVFFFSHGSYTSRHTKIGLSGIEKEGNFTNNTDSVGDFNASLYRAEEYERSKKSSVKMTEIGVNFFIPEILAGATTKQQFRTMDKIVAELQRMLPLHTESMQKERLALNPTTKTYEFDGKPFIWMFWEGRSRPAFVDLCILSTICQNQNTYNVRIMNISEFKRSVSFVHPGFDGLSLPHKADYFRAAMLDEFGGVYFDTDTISVKSIGKLYEHLDTFDVVGASSYVDSIHFGNMGPMRAKTPFTQRWLSELHKKYEKNAIHLRKKDPFEWTEVGGGMAVPILDMLVSNNIVKYYFLNGPESWIQFKPESLLIKKPDIVKTMKDTEIVVLSNSIYPVNYKKMSKREILRSSVGVSQLLRYSLAKCWNELHTK